MGIPSFYRHLCKSCPGVITSEIPKVDWLCLDFNCAIYFVLHKFKQTNPVQNASWEADLIQEVILYLKEIIRVADPAIGVFVSVDGAVCAAKRRQQRLRRFKSDPTATWDQNAITPGSHFMSMLNRGLKEEEGVTSGTRIIISGSDEPGEGEHKIMRFVRGEGLTGAIAIYGLDADLILLAMLLQADTGCSISLMREAQEFEKAPDSGGGSFRSLSINALQKALFDGGGGASDTRHTRDFVCAMSLLGNDFLPRSLTHTVREQGIPDLLKILGESMWSKGINLVTADNRVSIYGLLRIVSLWAHNEQADLFAAVQRAQKAANYPTYDEESEKNSLPAKWATITHILPHLHSQESWQSFYESWHPGTPANYLLGVAWIWDYYSGLPVDQAWNFEEHLPPTWSALEHELIRRLHDSGEGEGVLEPPVILYPSPLPDKLHLLSVLPMASIEKLLPPEFVKIAHQFPWYWPTSWGVHDVGKTQLWECEPVIPLLPELLLRSLRVSDKE